MKVAIIGTGYVGLTTAVALAYLGHEVTGVDTDPHKLALLQNGKIPIHEPGLAELMHHSAPNLVFTNDAPAAAADADLIIIAVNTPKNGKR